MQQPTSKKEQVKKTFSSELFLKKAYYYFVHKGCGIEVGTYILGSVEHFLSLDDATGPSDDVDRIVNVGGQGDWIPLIDSMIELCYSNPGFRLAFTKRKFTIPFIQKVKSESVIFKRKNVLFYAIESQSASTSNTKFDIGAALSGLGLTGLSEKRDKKAETDKKSENKKSKGPAKGKKKVEVQEPLKPNPVVQNPVNDNDDKVELWCTYSQEEFIKYVRLSMDAIDLAQVSKVVDEATFFKDIQRSFGVSFEDLKKLPLKLISDFVSTVFVIDEHEDKFLGQCEGATSALVFGNEQFGFVIRKTT